MSRIEIRASLRDRYHIYTVAKGSRNCRPTSTEPRSTGRATKIRTHFDTLNVGHAGRSYKTVNQLIETEPVDAWKSYFRWHTIPQRRQRPTFRKPSSTRTSPSSARTLEGTDGSYPPLEAMHADDRLNQALGEAVVRPGSGSSRTSPRSQSQHGQAGGRPRESPSATTSAPCRG